MYEDATCACDRARAVPVAGNAACRRALSGFEVGGDHVAAASRHGANPRHCHVRAIQLHLTLDAYGRNSPRWPTLGGTEAPSIGGRGFNSLGRMRGFDLVARLRAVWVSSRSATPPTAGRISGHPVGHVFVHGLTWSRQRVKPLDRQITTG
jgi:hypothetical protein